MTAAPFDLHALAAAIATTTARVVAFQEAVLRGADPARLEDPFAGSLRATSQKSVYDALVSDGSRDALALADHVRALLAARLRAKTATPRSKHRAAARVRVSIPGEMPKEISEVELRKKLASCTRFGDVALLVAAAGTLGGQELGLAKSDRDLTAEIDARLPPPLRASPSCATPEAILSATADLAAAALPGTGGADGATYATLLHAAFAHGAGGTLPARLGPSHVAAWLPPFALAWLDPKAGVPEAKTQFTKLLPPDAPADLGRLLARFGRAFVAGAPREGRPAALFLRPSDARGELLGALFGALPSRPAFHRRALGLGAGDARDEARKFLKSQLFFLRRAAVRAQLEALPAGARAAHDLLAEALAPLAVPSGSHPELLLLATGERAVGLPSSADAALQALLGAERLEAELVDLFDEDWFRNPRVAPFFLAALHDAEDSVFAGKSLQAPSVDPRDRLLARAGELL
jgi:hypothetical protein